MNARDTRFMRLALSLGRRGLGNVWPNPAVGCVIVKNGRILGRGWTQPGGRPHAEIHALNAVGADAQGADVYVTLEPCAHTGKTPPCADALINAKIARLVVASRDPDPRVDGQGLARIAAAGIPTIDAVLSGEANRDHQGFFTRIRQGRPMVTLKLATSFDGRIAMASGESRWITGPAARRQVHLLRSNHDAVMIGGGTARADDPILDVRDFGMVRQPVRVVLSRGLDLPISGRLAASIAHAPLWLLHGPGADMGLISAWQGMGARLFQVPLKAGHLDLNAAMQALGAAGLTRVFSEGGGAVAAGLIGAGLVDRLVGFTAGLALGADGRAAIGGLGMVKLAQAPRFTLRETRQVGVDVMHVWTPS